jgi:hypothetical protein
MSEEATLHCFLPRLDKDLRDRLETIRQTKATLLGSAGVPGSLEWKEVVALARDKLLHAPPGGEQAAAPPPPAAAAPAAPAPPAGGTPTPTTGAKPARKCSYCSPLNLGMDHHDAQWCYIDPASKVYKEDVRVRRIAAAKKKGVQLPAYLQDETPKAVNMVAHTTAVQEGLVEDVLGALRLVGRLSEAEV